MDNANDKIQQQKLINLPWKLIYFSKYIYTMYSFEWICPYVFDDDMFFSLLCVSILKGGRTMRSKNEKPNAMQMYKSY